MGQRASQRGGQPGFADRTHTGTGSIFTSMGALFQARLEMLFGAFSEAETEQFFKLFVKLTAGIDALEGERR